MLSKVTPSTVAPQQKPQNLREPLINVEKYLRGGKGRRDRQPARRNGLNNDDSTKSSNQHIKPIIYKRSQLEEVRKKLGQYIMGLQSKK